MEKPTSFLGYWYFRYLLITELYMVEKWERAMFHIVMLIVFTILSLFNSFIVLSMVSYITQSILYQPGLVEPAMHEAIKNEL